jgi:RNA polymerase sigma-70 factor (ECF subfamily)
MTEPRIHVRPSVEIGVHALEARGQAATLDAWDAHHGEIYAFLVDATRDASAAEDLLQDTFARLSREARAGRTPEQVRPWLYRVAGNLVVSRARRVLSARRWFDRIGVPQHREAVAEAPERRLLDREAFADLDGVLKRLPPDGRTALLLAAEGFTGHEIAAAIGRSEVATRTLLCRARVRVRHDLVGSGGEL